MTLSKLKQGTSLADRPLLMGIGWLAREDKLSFTQGGQDCETLPADVSDRVNARSRDHPAPGVYLGRLLIELGNQ
jgi:hypothetical protein